MHFLGHKDQALRVRLWASRIGLVAGVFALVATSAPPSWTVRTSAYAAFVQGTPGSAIHRVAPVVLRVDTPKGVWPVLLMAHRSHGFTEITFGVKNSVSTAVDVTWEGACEGCAQADVEVACRERRCTIEISIALDVRQYPAYPRDGSVSLTASIGGSGIGGGACSDQTKKSSTDTETAPDGLQLKLTIGDFEDIEGPDLGSPDPDVPAPVMIDGGPREGGLADAPERDASSQDGGALTDAAVDGGEAGVDSSVADGG